MGDLGLAQPLQPRHTAIEGFYEPVEVREHLAGVRAPVVFCDGHRFTRTNS